MEPTNFCRSRVNLPRRKLPPDKTIRRGQVAPAITNKTMKRKIYLASSWRNEQQPSVLQRLREAGHEVYDFRHPKLGDDGFSWSQIEPGWKQWNAEAFRSALAHPIAEHGFSNDWNAMLAADTCVLLMPCGRSAHIEAGYFVGAGKHLIILLAGEGEPELMYKMTPHICLTVEEVLANLAEPLPVPLIEKN